MNAQSDAVSKVFEQVMETFRKTAETGLAAQKELFQLWQKNWPDLGPSQPPWLDQMRQFQRAWSDTVLDLTRKHRDTLDRQYQAGVDALKEALPILWEASDRICGKRLKAVLPSLIEAMEHHGHLELDPQV